MNQFISTFTNLGITYGQDLWFLAKSKINPVKVKLTNKQEEYLNRLRRDGYVVIPNYWTPQKSLSFKKKLESYLKYKKNKIFDTGAYIRFWDDRKHDQGVRRLYHIDREIPELAKFRFDPFISKIVNKYYQFPFYSGALVYQHNTKTNIETREYHVDTFEPEFKAFLYLEKVTIGNGPFTYLRGSHRARLLRFRKQISGNKKGSSTSFYENDVKSILKNEVMIEGNPGTLILADVRGIHRGSPQKNGSRSVIVNYMYARAGDRELDK